MTKQEILDMICVYQHKEGYASYKMLMLAQRVSELMDEQGVIPDSEEARILYWEITEYKYSLYFNEDQNADLEKIVKMFSQETIKRLSRA